MKKNILITGAAGNLGQATVEKFLKEGHRVIAAVSPGRKLDRMNGDIVTVETDLTQEKTVEEVVKKIVAAYQSIDAVLLLVGGYDGGDIFETDGASLRKMYSLNFETAYNVARPVFMQMMRQPLGGRIIFVGARPALSVEDGKNSLAYALSKSLIFKLADYLNAEGASKNVTSTVIVPSIVDTPANRSAMPKANFTSWVTPDTIADVMAFVISENAGSLRETVLKVYGNA